MTGGATTLSATTSGGDWYSSNNAVATVGASSGVVTGVSAGSAVVTYIKFEECGMTYDLHTVNVTPARPTVVNNADAADMFHAYPNPTKGALFVNTATTGTLSMMTLDGKEVNYWKLSTGETALTLPKSLATGLYICKFIGTDGATKIVRLVYEQ